MNDREQILRRVRAALHRDTDREHRAPAATARDAPMCAGGGDDREVLAERFAARLLAVAGRCVRAEGPEAVTTLVAEELRRAAVTSVAVGSGALPAAVATALRREGMRIVDSAGAPRDASFAADAGITAAQWGIAETGTIVLDADAATARLPSLLPPLHIALLPHDRLLPDLDRLLAALPQPIPHAVTFVTGPSRTADIELQLVVGVHGPRDLLVVLF